MMFDNKYPYTDFHELDLDWFLEKFKELVAAWEQMQADWNSLQDFVQNYFDNLNVQTEIDNKINAMIADGSFATIITPLVEAALPTLVDGKLPAVVASQIGAVVAAQIDAVVAGQLPAVAASAAAQEVGTWLAAHVNPDTGYVIDNTLTVSLAAADAKVTGDRINYIFNNYLQAALYTGQMKKGTEVSAYQTDSTSSLTALGGSTPTLNNYVRRFQITKGQYYLLSGYSDAPVTICAQYEPRTYGSVVSGTIIPINSEGTYNYLFKAEGIGLFVDCGKGDNIKLYNIIQLKHNIYVGSNDWCDFTNVQDALNAITDDSATKHYTIHVMPGTYPTFSMKRSDPARTEDYGRLRYISIDGTDPYLVKFTDNRGSRKLSPCEIYTEGKISGITFEVETDSEHFDPSEGQTSCYAVHQDYGVCHTQYENCIFKCNAGPGLGVGLFDNSTIDINNCLFISTCDGSLGPQAGVGQGGIFVHTYSSLNRALNQVLNVRESKSIAPYQNNGGRFAVIGSSHELYGSTYDFNFQNFGCFGQSGPAVNIQDPDGDLLGDYNFNNVPSTLNTI